MKRSESIAELSKALTAFQKVAPIIKKDKEAKLQLKNGGQYGYKYADLSSIMDVIRGPLADNGLAIVQSPTAYSAEPMLTTMVSHSSGQYIEDTMQLKITQDTPQGQGSAITYARRYMLTAMLGLVADDDTDAQDHKTISVMQKKRLADTAKSVVPELGEDPLSLVRFLAEVTGKHPSRILVDEFEDALAAVEIYTSKATTNE